MIIYTDGSCKSNGKENSSGGYGIVVCNDNNILIDCYQHKEDNTTNNRQELKAILYCLIKYGKINPTVYSDSAYSINTLTNWMYGWAKNGWIKSDNKIPENLDLIKGFFEIQNPNNKITLIKVKGHNGVLGNELADKLATYELTTEDVKRLYGGKVI